MAFILGALLLRPEDVEAGAEPEAEPEPEPADPAEARARRRAAEPSGRPSLRTVIAVPFIILAAYSSFLALRDAVVAPDDRFQELKALRDEVAGSSVLALTSDRYTDYYLRGAEVLSPAKNAEQKIPGRRGKEFRLPVDFDSVYASDLDGFDYVVTTDAEYQSGAPPNFEEVQRTDSYVLWKRNGVTPFIGVLAEASRPGRIFRCNRPKFKRLLEPHRRRDHLAAPGDRQARDLGARREDSSPATPRRRPSTCRPGRWDLSFQYSSEAAPVEVTVGDLTVEMPPGVEGGDPLPAERGAVLARRRGRLRRRPGRDRGDGEGALDGPEADRRRLARRTSATSPRRASRTAARCPSRPRASATSTTTTSGRPARCRDRRSRAGAGWTCSRPAEARAVRALAIALAGRGARAGSGADDDRGRTGRRPGRRPLDRRRRQGRPAGLGLRGHARGAALEFLCTGSLIAPDQGPDGRPLRRPGRRSPSCGSGPGSPWSRGKRRGEPIRVRRARKAPELQLPQGPARPRGPHPPPARRRTRDRARRRPRVEAGDPAAAPGALGRLRHPERLRLQPRRPPEGDARDRLPEPASAAASTARPASTRSRWSAPSAR